MVIVNKILVSNTLKTVINFHYHFEAVVCLQIKKPCNYILYFAQNLKG